MAVGRSAAWAGWIVFAGTVMIVTSFINMFQGMVALLDDERVVATADAFVIVDMTSWGWTLILSGAVLLTVGIFLLAGMNWARIAAIIVVGLHAVIQVAWLGAYPIWSLLMIALDIVVLFALTARWSQAGEDLRSHEGGVVSEGDPLHGRLPHEMTGPYYGPRVT
ncbi:DUF7144 family membrane protein [Actinoplanes sp. CA-015351]|uniref:DUF7144 family membrane protein n=1 Tax=Actinoplanes sp. CA-015351 TaxID=3239897 RepID=UPI003D990C4D